MSLIAGTLSLTLHWPNILSLLLRLKPALVGRMQAALLPASNVDPSS